MGSQAPTLFSHQVDILYDFNPTPICSGTIISSYLILTLASCLDNRRILKLTVQTQNPPQFRGTPHPKVGEIADDYNDNPVVQEEQVSGEKEAEVQWRYVDDIYTIQAVGPNETFQRDHQLAVIILDQKLEWNRNVSRANLLATTDKLSQIRQPYKCFTSGNVEERWKAGSIRPVGFVQDTNSSKCTSKTDAGSGSGSVGDSLSRHVFPRGCLSDTPRSFGQDHDLVCPAPLSGSGIFCDTIRQSPIEKEHGHTQNMEVLCGVLSQDRRGPLYINVSHYLHGIYLPKDEDEEDEDEDVAELPENAFGLVATSIGGQEVDFKVTPYPYQLSLQELRKKNWDHICGATLLDNRTALTAAHCFDERKRNSLYRLVAGLRKLDQTGNATSLQILPVQRIKLHEQWQNKRFSRGFDIALLTVAGSFLLNENVSTIWISTPDEPVLSDFNGTATGWGVSWGVLGKDNDSVLTNHLMAVDLPLRPHEECNKFLSFFRKTMTCAQTGYSNICQGDSGGPLVLRNYELSDRIQGDLLVGISSFGPYECHDLSKPSGFTRVRSFYEWIQRNWQRTPSVKNKFQCFSGQEIDEDLKCNEEFDCEDGSDEKGCTVQPIQDVDRPKTRGCGGEIKLEDEHDIIYRVEDSEPGKMALCVWTIANVKKRRFHLTLLNNIDANFNPVDNQLIALHNLAFKKFSNASITKVGEKIQMLTSYATLIFRGPAGIRDSGFHLRIKSVGNLNDRNPYRYKRMDLKPTSSLQTHSYPINGSYGVRERVFMILSPVERGGRIKLNVTFGDMETGRDWFDIISIGQQPQPVFRFSGVKNNMNERVEAGVDEILLVVMATETPAAKGEGIKFTYSEEPPNSTAIVQEIGCGGYLNLTGNVDLLYKVNPLKSKSSCAWVVSKPKVRSSLVTLLDSRSQVFNLTDGASSLYLLHSFTRTRDKATHHINEFGRTYRVDEPFFVLYFRSSTFSTTTGFFLKMRHQNSNSSSVLQFGENLTPLNQTQEFSYPVTQSGNGRSNSKGTAVILVQPTQNDRKVHLKLKSIHLPDENEEWLDILTFRERPVSIYRTSGSKNITDKSFISSEGEPFVIYLKSKSNSSNLQQKTRLTFSYSEQREKLPETESCGGVIKLGRRHRISYRAPRGQRSHCLWVVHNAHGPHSNITASFDTTNSQIFLIQDVNRTDLGRDEAVITESSVSALYFRSNGNAETLTVSLNGVNDFEPGPGENSLGAKAIVLQARSQRMKQFAYPPPPALTYENNERVFILVTPERSAEARNNVQLNVTFVDTEPRFDTLEMYTFRRDQPNEINHADDVKFGSDGKLQLVSAFSNFGTWVNKTFSGESGEPFILHFRSDSGTVKTGFKFNYKNIIPSNEG